MVKKPQQSTLEGDTWLRAPVGLQVPRRERLDSIGRHLQTMAADFAQHRCIFASFSFRGTRERAKASPAIADGPQTCPFDRRPICCILLGPLFDTEMHEMGRYQREGRGGVQPRLNFSEGRDRQTKNDQSQTLGQEGRAREETSQKGRPRRRRHREVWPTLSSWEGRGWRLGIPVLDGPSA